MNDYKELIATLRTHTEYCEMPLSWMNDAADAIEQLVKERDAAVADLAEDKSCYTCKNINNSKVCGECYRIDLLADIRRSKMWEWRGVREAEHK